MFLMQLKHNYGNIDFVKRNIQSGLLAGRNVRDRDKFDLFGILQSSYERAGQPFTAAEGNAISYQRKSWFGLSVPSHSWLLAT